MPKKIAFFEVYLHECDKSEVVPSEYRMGSTFFDNLKSIITLAQKNSLPTVRFELEDDYHYLDEGYEKELTKKLLKTGKPVKLSRPLKPNVKFQYDERSISQYKAVILTGISPTDVRYIHPQKYRTVESVIDDLKKEGIETAIVVGGFLGECVGDIIRFYIKNQLTVLVPYDATNERREGFDNAKKEIEKLGAKILTTEELISRVFES